MPSAFAAIEVDVIRRRLRQLPGKRLRHETYISPAGAAKFRTVEILGCTVRTKHSYLPSYSVSVFRRFNSAFAKFTFLVLRASLSQRFIENYSRCNRNVE